MTAERTSMDGETEMDQEVGVLMDEMQDKIEQNVESVTHDSQPDEMDSISFQVEDEDVPPTQPSRPEGQIADEIEIEATSTDTVEQVKSDKNASMDRDEVQTGEAAVETGIEIDTMTANDALDQTSQTQAEASHVNDTVETRESEGSNNIKDTGDSRDVSEQVGSKRTAPPCDTPPCKKRTNTPQREPQPVFASPDAGAPTPEHTTGGPSTRSRALTDQSSEYPSRVRRVLSGLKFCLSGFSKTGGPTLQELLVGHGGQVINPDFVTPESTNGHSVVVIATPISWRKLKLQSAVAYGFPVLHPEWISACLSAGKLLPYDGYQVPLGFSVLRKRSVCRGPKRLKLLNKERVGVMADWSRHDKSNSTQHAKLMASLVQAMGALEVVNRVQDKHTCVDILLSDEMTSACREEEEKGVRVYNYQWLSECILLQEMVPDDVRFRPYDHQSEETQAPYVDIGGDKLKLQVGELVMVDLKKARVDHVLLFDVCEITRILERENVRKTSTTFEVRVLHRTPNSAGISRDRNGKVLQITSGCVKRRVVGISKADFEQLQYRDESVFYFEDGSE